MWLKNYVERIAKPIFKQYQTPYYRILSEWHLIVGSQFLHSAFPVNISFFRKESNDATLVLEVKNPCCALEVQMMSSTLINRVCSYFGYQVISKIKIIVSGNSRTSSNAILATHSSNKKKNKLGKIEDIIEIINQNQDDDMKRILTEIAHYL